MAVASVAPRLAVGALPVPGAPDRISHLHCLCLLDWHLFPVLEGAYTPHGYQFDDRAQSQPGEAQYAIPEVFSACPLRIISMIRGWRSARQRCLTAFQGTCFA